MSNNIFMDKNKFIEKHTSIKSDFTRQSYEWCLSRFLTWIEQNKLDPEKLDPESFDRFLNDQDWGGNTRRMVACAVRAFYRWRFGDAHPMLSIKIRRVKSPTQRSLSQKQVVKLLAAVDNTRRGGKRDLAMLYLMLDTGLRESEICRLSVKFLDLEERKLQVLCKGGEWEKAVFSQTTAEHLGKWIAERERYRGKFGKLADAVFFSLSSGQQIKPAGLRDVFERLSKKVGFTVSPHDLRRTFATLATKRGAPTRVIMAAGRWKNLGTLEGYLRHIEPEDFEEYFPTLSLN